jgi:hypothetical protein
MPSIHTLKNNKLTQINKVPFGTVVQVCTLNQITGRNRRKADESIRLERASGAGVSAATALATDI